MDTLYFYIWNAKKLTLQKRRNFWYESQDTKIIDNWDSELNIYRQKQTILIIRKNWFTWSHADNSWLFFLKLFNGSFHFPCPNNVQCGKWICKIPAIDLYKRASICYYKILTLKRCLKTARARKLCRDQAIIRSSFLGHPCSIHLCSDWLGIVLGRCIFTSSS